MYRGALNKVLERFYNFGIGGEIINSGEKVIINNFIKV